MVSLSLDLLLPGCDRSCIYKSSLGIGCDGSIALWGLRVVGRHQASEVLVM